MKIVSLVPSISELVYDLGLNTSLIGVTKFCVHPTTLRKENSVVGGTKTLHLDRIRALQPDLIIANKEENEKDQVEVLQKEFNVWVTDIRSLEASWDFILELGSKTNTELKAKFLVATAKKEWATVKGVFKKRVLYFIWQDPYMTIGKNTFINSILAYIGFVNVAADLPGNYPIISAEWIRAQKPELLLLSSEPFPFKEKHMAAFASLNSLAKPLLIDGEMCSWYGSRMLLAPAYFRVLANAVEETKK